MAETLSLDHGFGPLYNADSRVLILGSFPSVKSREQQFYYGHPQNRFWRIARALSDPAIMQAGLAGNPIDPPETIEEKKELILAHHMALWDTIEHCTITGSSDSTIRDVTVTDIGYILRRSQIRRIYCNGAASYNLYLKYMPSTLPRPVKLPSTSPANAAWTLPKLLKAWGVILDDLQPS